MEINKNNSDLNALIEDNLKRFFQGNIDEPLPPRFLDLLDQLQQEFDADEKAGE